MWPDGRYERFDEVAMLRSNQHFTGLVDENTGLVLPLKQAGRASIYDFYNITESTLRSFQSYFIPDDTRGGGYYGWLPYAFLVEKGMKLVNIDTNVEYTIEEVFEETIRDHTYKCYVRLSDDVAAPSITDRLELEDHDRVQFSRASARRDQGTDYEADATRQDTQGLWNAYIDFAVITEEDARSEPGSPRPTVIGRKKMLREIINSTEPNLGAKIYGRLMDAVVQFDLWGSTADEAERLVQWFYDYIDLNHWIFIVNGIGHLYFRARGMDQPIGKWRGNLFHRPLRYNVRLERLYTVHHRRLDHITAYVRTQRDRILTDAESPRTGRPTYSGNEIPVTTELEEL